MSGTTGDVIQAAKSKVMGPAIGLILTGVITLCLVAYGFVKGAGGGGGDFETQWAAEVKKIEDDQTKKDDEKKATLDMMSKIHDVLKPVADFAIVFQISALAIGVLCVVGSLRVMSLRSRGLGFFSAIISMVPIYGCCCLGIPFGIWMIVALSNSVVKRGFAATAGGSMGGPSDDLDPGFER